MAVVLVGAIFVSCMETVWDGIVNPHLKMQRLGRTFTGDGQPSRELNRGAELGHFNMGSTVILLFGPGQAQWSDALKPGSTVTMGREIGTLQAGNSA